MKYRNPISWLITKFFPCLICAQTLVAAPFAYVTNNSDNTVSVIDTATNASVGLINVGYRPLGIAITPNGLKAYVCNASDSSISVINTTTNTVLGSPINLGDMPNRIAITPNGSRAYVCCRQGVVLVINTATDSLIDHVSIPVGQNPQGIAITPDGTRLYVCNADDRSLSIIDTATNTVVGSPIPVGSYPNDIAITPDGTKAYVCNANDRTISVIKLATNASIATIPTDLPPSCIAITPDGTKAYVSTGNNALFSAAKDKDASALNIIPILVSRRGEVIVINTSTDKVIGSPIYPNNALPFGIAFTPDGAKAYVCTPLTGDVSEIDTGTNEVVGQPIPVGHDPTYIAIGPSPVIPSAPRKFIGKIKRLEDSSWKKTTLFMKWKKSTSPDIDHYEIFGSGQLLASIPASASLKFHKRLQPYVRDERLSKKYLRFLHDKYRIRAVTLSGTASAFKKLKIVKVNTTKNDFNAFRDPANLVNLSSL